MSPGPRVARARGAGSLRRTERLLAWTMPALALAVTSAFFVAVGLGWPPLKQPLGEWPISLGAALALACLALFIGMIVLYTIVSGALDRREDDAAGR